MKNTLKYYRNILLLFCISLLSGCREIFNFIDASLDLGVAFFKWVFIIIIAIVIIGIIIGIIRKIFGLNDD